MRRAPAPALACWALLVLPVLAIHVGRAAPVQLHDDRGVTVRLAAPAQRIISLAPHLAEIAYAAGAGAKLAAVSAFSDHPPQARRLPRVGDGARVDIERILTLKPDLVLAWKSGNQASDIARLEQFGIAVWVSEASRLVDIPRLVRGVAHLAGSADAGERAAMQFERDVQALRERYAEPRAGATGLRVFYEIWGEPLMTVNREHLISDAIALCGGTNVFGEVNALTPSVTLEALIGARPHIILGGGSSGGEAEFLARWRAVPVPSLRAIPAAYVAPERIQRASPRILDGVRALCAHLEAVRPPLARTPLARAQR